ncbi:MAG TPA: O-antigen ligase family protein [Methylomirabilota bacterium]|nr:O-antigen ligase family protein [Methylomirabilota bacterium]
MWPSGGLRSRARTIAECGLLVYLLTIPMGRALPGWTRELPLLLIVWGMVLARLPRGRPSPSVPPFGLLVPFALFMSTTGISVLFSAFPEASLSRAAYAPIAALLFLAIQDVLIQPSAYRRLLVVASVVVLLLGLDGAYQFWTGASLLGGNLRFGGPGGRIAGSLPNPNDMALIPILLPLALTVVVFVPWPWATALTLLGLPVALATTLLSGSRNAWLGLAVAFGTLGAFRSHHRLALGAAALAAALFAAALALGLGHIADRMHLIFDAPNDPRVGYWLVAWRMFTESPLFGKGIHTYEEFYLPYLSRIRLPAGYAPEVAFIPWAHNLYLEILAERGIVGAVGCGALGLAITRGLVRVFVDSMPAEAKCVAAGVASALAAFLVLGIFDLTFLKDWVLLIFVLLAALVARLPIFSGSVPPPPD